MSNYYVSRGMLGKPLNAGTDRRNQVYNRNVGFQPGYDDLVNIIAGLQKDVKKINQCITLQGAQEYVNAVDKAGKRIRNNWSAHEEDITGPNGKPDGIKEVFVCDAKGNLKVINGYGLGKTKYPIRKAYRTKYPTKEDRAEHPFTQFKQDLYGFGGLNEEGIPVYRLNPGTEIGPEFANLQSIPDPRKVYKELIFKPVYDSKKEVLKTQKGLEPMAMAQFFNANLSDCYNNHVKDQILAVMLGKSPEDATQKEVNKALRSKEFKDRCADRVSELVKDSLEAAQGEVDGLLEAEIQRIPDIQQ